MKKVINIILSVAFICYLLFFAFNLFFSRASWISGSFIDYIKNSSNFIPFKTISTYVKALIDGSMNMDIPIKNLAGNFLLFLPMGIYFPLFFKKIQTKHFFISIILLIFAVEVIQILTRRGSFDVDDFILNMAGAFLGFVVLKRIQKAIHSPFHKENTSFS